MGIFNNRNEFGQQEAKGWIAAFLDEKRKAWSPLWIIGMIDLRDSLPGAETCHEYRAFVHAVTGEFVVPPTVAEYEIGW